MEGGCEAELKFCVSAGVAMRNQILSEIKKAVFLRGLEINIEEDKRLFASNYRITIRGEEGRVREFHQAIWEWGKKIATE